MSTLLNSLCAIFTNSMSTSSEQPLANTVRGHESRLGTSTPSTLQQGGLSISNETFTGTGVDLALSSGATISIQELTPARCETAIAIDTNLLASAVSTALHYSDNIQITDNLVDNEISIVIRNEVYHQTTMGMDYGTSLRETILIGINRMMSADLASAL